MKTHNEKEILPRLAPFAWIPLPLFILTIILLRVYGVKESYPSMQLQLICNFLFTVLPSLAVVILLGKSFLERGTTGLLFIACAVLIWGGIGISGFFVKNHDIHLIIIIYNSCVWLSALLHLIGRLLLNRKDSMVNHTGKWLIISQLFSAIAVLIVASSFGFNNLPVYFVESQSGYFLRNLILGTSILMFAINFSMLFFRQKGLSAFLKWYTYAIGLLGIGLFGFIFEEAHADPISWTARTAQYLSGIYMLFAALMEVKDLRLWKISMRAALQESEEATLKAEASDKFKSLFLANMSHELRSPLNSIIGFCGILLKEMPGPLNEEQKKQLGIVQASGRHLLSLINDILDISKIEAGQMSVDYEKFDFDVLLKDTLAMVEPLAGEKNLQLEVAATEKIGAIESDRKKVQQIMLNLLNNAVKFTEKGSVTIRSYKEDQFLQVHIQDTGIGIQSADLSKLFNPFSQIENDLTKRYKGSGLGLSISRKLLDLLGGTLSVVSEFGYGSTFTVCIPVSRYAQSSADQTD